MLLLLVLHLASRSLCCDTDDRIPLLMSHYIQDRHNRRGQLTGREGEVAQGGVQTEWTFSTRDSSPLRSFSSTSPMLGVRPALRYGNISA